MRVKILTRRMPVDLTEVDGAERPGGLAYVRDCISRLETHPKSGDMVGQEKAKHASKWWGSLEKYDRELCR